MRTNKQSRSLSHLIFIVLAMLWLSLFVWFAPNMGLLGDGRNSLDGQTLFAALFCAVLIILLFLPRAYSFDAYRKLTLIGVLGTSLACVCFLAEFFPLQVCIAGLAVFSALFTYSGILFILMRVLDFRTQIAAVLTIVGLMALFSLLFDILALDIHPLAFWLICFTLLASLAVISWIGFYPASGRKPGFSNLVKQETVASAAAKKTAVMLRIAYAVVFVVTLITVNAIILIQKLDQAEQLMPFFYIGQLLTIPAAVTLMLFKRGRLERLFYGFLVIAFLGFSLNIFAKTQDSKLLPLSAFFLGGAELGSILEWCLIPRVCALWDLAHVSDRDRPVVAWGLRALRGFMLVYALAVAAGSALGEYLFAQQPAFQLILSMLSLVILFAGNMLLTGFTQYRFFPFLNQIEREDTRHHTQNQSASPSNRKADLSRRETEVFGYILQGYSLPQIAERLFISLNTVKAHTRRIYRKLAVKTRQELILRYANHTTVTKPKLPD